MSFLEKVDCISDFHLQILMSDFLPMIATLFSTDKGTQSWRNRPLLCLLRTQAEVQTTRSRFIPSSLLSARHFLILFLWIYDLKACLHEGGVPQVGEVTCGWLPHLTCKRDHFKTRDCMDRRVTPPRRVTSPIWGTPPPCKQALRFGPPMNHVAFLKTDAHVSNRTVRCVRKK